jgi:hypothetical protein
MFHVSDMSIGHHDSTTENVGLSTGNMINRTKSPRRTVVRRQQFLCHHVFFARLVLLVMMRREEPSGSEVQSEKRILSQWTDASIDGKQFLAVLKLIQPFYMNFEDNLIQIIAKRVTVFWTALN